MKYRFRFYLLFLIIVSIIVNGCNTPTGPKKDDNTIQPPANDTTSQNFTFETFSFGDGYESNWFDDVWVFDENNIWASGYIRPSKSIPSYNIMKWNGHTWSKMGWQFNSAGVYGIWPVDTAHIYFALTTMVEYKSGIFNHINIPGNYLNYQSIEHLWGSSENNIWGVGPNGTIVHFNGKEWKKNDFDYNYNFIDISGSKSSGIAYALAYLGEHAQIVELSENTQRVIYNSKEALPPYEAWSIALLNEKELILGWDFIWKYNIETKLVEKLYTPPSVTGFNNISVVSPNDIYFYGSGTNTDILTHYNGIRFTRINLPIKNDFQTSIKAVNGAAAVVGIKDMNAVITIIKRSP